MRVDEDDDDDDDDDNCGRVTIGSFTYMTCQHWFPHETFPHQKSGESTGGSQR